MQNVVPIADGKRVSVVTGASRYDKNIKTQIVDWEKFRTKLFCPTKIQETRADVAKMTKAEVGRLKDVGWYLLGATDKKRRKKESIELFSGVTLDIDYATSDTLLEVAMGTDGATYALHSTFSSTPAMPRYRLVVPTNRAITREEYVPLARALASRVGIDAVDTSSYQLNRLMYWPCIPADADMVTKHYDGKLLDVDEVLADLRDWTDPLCYPRSQREIEANARVTTGMEIAPDPRDKAGVIGAFCRAFTIEDAMAAFIPDVYEEAGDGRYTYLDGTGYGGAKTYDTDGESHHDSLWLYSHHGTDPCSGVSVNAFDMVRLHKFGGEDENTPAGSAITDRPSYHLMKALCQTVPALKERIVEEAEAAFDGIEAMEVDASGEPDDDEYLEIQDVVKGGADELNAFLKRYIYVEEGNQVADIKRPAMNCLTNLESFKNSTANVRTEVDAPTQKEPDKTKFVPTWQVWLSHRDRRLVRGECFIPNKGRVVKDNGMRYINTYQKVMWPRVNDSSLLLPFTDHIRYLFPIESECEDFFNWLAFTIQHPEKRCKWTPLSVADHFGTGRGWTIKLLEKLLGAWNVRRPTMDELFDRKFNGYMYQSLVCVVEEVDGGQGNRYKAGARIRDTLDSDRLDINRKNKEQITADVYANFYMMTNHRNALVLPEHDRRVYVMSGPDHVKPEKYYAKLYALLDNPEFIAAVYTWLMARDISKANFQRAPMTPAKRHMVEAGRSDLERALNLFLEKNTFDAMSLEQISRSLHQEDESLAIMTDEKSTKHLAYLLRDAGYEASNPLRIGTGKPRLRLWWLNKTEMYKASAAKKSYEAAENSLAEKDFEEVE